MSPTEHQSPSNASAVLSGFRDPIDEHEVALLHGAAAHRADDRRVRGIDETATLLGVQVQRAAGVEQTRQRRAAVARAAAGDDQKCECRVQSGSARGRASAGIRLRRGLTPALARTRPSGIDRREVYAGSRLNIAARCASPWLSTK